jgi:trans-aconitate methyltransferase
VSDYRPREYWANRGKVYRQQFKRNRKREMQEHMLIDYLKTLPPFQGVLEVGCGFGRITKLILENFSSIQEYMAVDLSREQIEEAKKYVGDRIDRNIKFLATEIQSLNLNRRYDLVLSVSVLMHILPNEIESVMNKLIGMTGRDMVNVDWYEIPVPEDSGNHNFVHKYESIYRNNPMVRKIVRIPIIKKGLSVFDTKQSIFHATVR